MRNVKFFVIIIFICNVMSCSFKKCDKKISDFFKDHEKTYVNYNQRIKPYIDMYQRETFSKYAIENIKINYEEFYLVEIETRGETNTSTKVLIIRCGNSYHSFFFVFEKGMWCKRKMPNNYLIKYSFKNLKSDIREENQNQNQNQNIFILHEN